MNTFATRLQMLMRKTQTTQLTLCRAVGMSQASISRYNQEQHRIPQADTAAKIATYFKCDLLWLITGEGEPPFQIKDPRNKTSGCKKRRSRQGTEFPNITAHAKALGCSRLHLWHVLKGTRKAPHILEAYQRLTSPAAPNWQIETGTAELSPATEDLLSRILATEV